MSELFNAKDIIFHLINLIILVVACRFLVYKPVAKFMNKRREGFENERKQLDERQKALDAFEQNKEQLMSDAKQQAAAYSVEQKKQADEQAAIIIETAQRKAKEESSRRLAEADNMVKNEMRYQQEKIIDSAIAMAKNIVQKEVSQADEDKFVEEFINAQAGETEEQ